MNAVYVNLFPAMWFAWALYWWIASRGVKQAVRLESPASWLGHVVPLVVAGCLLLSPLPDGVLDGHFIARSPVLYAVGAVLTAFGLGFAAWARLHIGRNWSGTVTVKADHELIRSGPYAIVRHPIYTGLIAGFLGSALALSEWRGLLAVAIVFVALWRKSRLEERWMTEQFGAQYATYRSEVRALVPYVF